MTAPVGGSRIEGRSRTDGGVTPWHPSGSLRGARSPQEPFVLMDEPSTHAADLLASRDTLDRLDRALLDLVAQRRAVVASLFEIKRRRGLPLIDPDRERMLLASRRALAEQLGIPGDLAERLFQVILEGSHAQASDAAPTPEPSG